MLKGLIAFMILVFIGVMALLYFGGVIGMDPAQEAKDFRAQLQQGMAWDAVADLHEPRRYIVFDLSNPHNMSGERQPAKFNRTDIQNAVQGGHFADGFKFRYAFTSEEQFEVFFNSQGKLVDVVDVFTVGDLMRGEAFKR